MTFWKHCLPHQYIHPMVPATPLGTPDQPLTQHRAEEIPPRLGNVLLRRCGAPNRARGPHDPQRSYRRRRRLAGQNSLLRHQQILDKEPLGISKWPGQARIHHLWCCRRGGRCVWGPSGWVTLSTVVVTSIVPAQHDLAPPCCFLFCVCSCFTISMFYVVVFFVPWLFRVLIILNTSMLRLSCCMCLLYLIPCMSLSF